MSCANCHADRQPAYTLRAHVENEETVVDLRFCSIDCLEDWT